MSDADLMAALSAPAQAAAPAPGAAQAGPRFLPDITDPASPDYSRRHGGGLVTGLVDSIASAATLPGDVATGKVDPYSPEATGRVLDMALIANPAPPAAVTTAGRAGQAVAPKPVPAPVRPDGNAIAEAGSRIGVDVPRAIASDSRMVQAAGAGIRNVPFAGAPMMAAAERTVGQLGEAAGRVAGEFGGANVAEAGAAAREALTVGWKGRTAANQERLYGRVDSLVDPVKPTPLEGTRGVVADILARRAASRIDDTGGAVAIVSDAIRDSGGLTYDGIKNLRTHIGERLKDRNALASANISQQELAAIYGGLSKDLRASVEASGGQEALRAFEAANGYTAAVKGREKRLQQVVGATSDEGVVERLAAAAASKGQRADIELLMQARKAAGPEAWDDLAGAIVGRLGRAPDGAFSPDRFITDFGKMSKEGRALLFGSTGRGDLARALADIETVSSRFKELNKYANPSGTGRAVGFSAGGYGLATDPLTTLGLTVGANVVARILAAPATASSAARWARAYERVVTTPSAGTQAALNAASRNLANTLNAKAVSGIEATAFAAAVNDNLLLGGMRSGRASQQDEGDRRQQ